MDAVLATGNSYDVPSVVQAERLAAVIAAQRAQVLCTRAARPEERMYGGSSVRAASHVAGMVNSERLAVITARQHTDDLQGTTAGGHECARAAAVRVARTPHELAAEIYLVHDDAPAPERSDFRYGVALG